MEVLKNGFEQILPIISVGLLALVAKYILQWLGEGTDKVLMWITKFGEHLNSLKYLRIAECDDFILERLASAVQGVKDSYVDSIKAARADGKLTVEEVKEANSLAFKSFKGSLSEVELKTVIEILGKDFKNIVIARLPGIVAGLKFDKWFGSDEKEAIEIPEEIVAELVKAKKEAEVVNPK